MKNTTCIIKYY